MLLVRKKELASPRQTFASIQTKSVKCPRRLSSEQQPEQGRLPVHYGSSSFPASSTTSAEASKSPRLLNEAVDKGSNSETKLPNPGRHVSSGISLRSPGIPLGKRYLAEPIVQDSYDWPSPTGYPSGIDGDPFPHSYEIPCSPVHAPESLEGGLSPNTYSPPSPSPSLVSDSTLKKSLPVMTPEQAQKSSRSNITFTMIPTKGTLFQSLCTLTPSLPATLPNFGVAFKPQACQGVLCPIVQPRTRTTRDIFRAFEKSITFRNHV